MPDDQLSVMFSALADPTRRAILARLAKGEATVNQLGQPFDLSQPAISKHIAVLERAGFITRSRIAQTRPCRLDPKRMKEIARWCEGYRSLWEDSFDALENYLTAAQPKSSCSPARKGRHDARKNRK